MYNWQGIWVKYMSDKNEGILTLYVLFFQREHKHIIFTFYVIPPH